MSKLDIRKIVEAELPQLRDLRLRSLKEHPEAFGVAYEEELATPPEKFNEKLSPYFNSLDNLLLGAFLDGSLVGMLAFSRYGIIKFRHTGYIWGMYVAGEAQGHGIGKALMQAAIAHARSLPDLEKINLDVVPTNASARGLYLSLGFVPFGRQPRALKVDGIYHDLESLTLDFASEKQ
jgi:ribosomal protein S18 acetylase RimI-like enzyme